MCVYSAFVSEAMKQWPGISPDYQPWTTPGFPGPGDKRTIPAPAVPSEDILKEIRALGKRLDALDKKLGAKDCTQEEAAKRAFEKRLDDFIQQAQDLKKSVECDNDGCPSQTYISTGGVSGSSVTHTSGYAQVSSSPGIGLGNGAATLSKGV